MTESIRKNTDESKSDRLLSLIDLDDGSLENIVDKILIPRFILNKRSLRELNNLFNLAFSCKKMKESIQRLCVVKFRRIDLRPHYVQYARNFGRILLNSKSFEIDDEDYPAFLKLPSFCGENLSSLKLPIIKNFNMLKSFFSDVSKRCHNLSVLSFCDLHQSDPFFDGSSNIVDIIRNMVYLKDLEITNPSGQTLDLLATCLPSIQKLSISDIASISPIIKLLQKRYQNMGHLSSFKPIKSLRLTLNEFEDDPMELFEFVVSRKFEDLGISGLQSLSIFITGIDKMGSLIKTFENCDQHLLKDLKIKLFDLDEDSMVQTELDINSGQLLSNNYEKELERIYTISVPDFQNNIRLQLHRDHHRITKADTLVFNGAPRNNHVEEVRIDDQSLNELNEICIPSVKRLVAFMWNVISPDIQRITLRMMQNLNSVELFEFHSPYFCNFENILNFIPACSKMRSIQLFLSPMIRLEKEPDNTSRIEPTGLSLNHISKLIELILVHCKCLESLQLQAECLINPFELNQEERKTLLDVLQNIEELEKRFSEVDVESIRLPIRSLLDSINGFTILQ